MWLHAELSEAELAKTPLKLGPYLEINLKENKEGDLVGIQLKYPSAESQFFMVEKNLSQIEAGSFNQSPDDEIAGSVIQQELESTSIARSIQVKSPETGNIIQLLEFDDSKSLRHLNVIDSASTAEPLNELCCWQSKQIPYGQYIIGIRINTNSESGNIDRLDFLLGGEEIAQEPLIEEQADNGDIQRD